MNNINYRVRLAIFFSLRMKKRRFHIDCEKDHTWRVGETVRLSPRETHHLIHVLRLARGAPLRLFDSHGREMEGMVKSLDPEGVEVTLTALFLSEREADIPEKIDSALYPLGASLSFTIPVGLGLPLLKADKLETTLRMTTEMGASFFHLFASRRCVVRFDPVALNNKRERWQHIILDAVRVSGRRSVPSLDLHPSLDDLLETIIPQGPVLLPYEEKGFPLLSRLLPQVPLLSSNRPWVPEKNPSPLSEEIRRAGCIFLVTGPEGGWSKEEVETAQARGVLVCSLGSRILRAETAPIAGLAVILSFLGEL